jgi:hypothetical protein
MQDIKSTTEKNGLASRAISVAMWIRRYDAERIAQYGRSRATLDTNGRRHRANIHPVLPRRMPWSSISAYKIELWRCGNWFSKLALKIHETDPLLSSLKRQAALKG